MPVLAADIAASLPVERALDCLAAFYANEADWQLAARALQIKQLLQPAQLTQLRPSDAAPAIFSKLSKQWQCRAKPAALDLNWADERWLLVGLGALCGGVVAMGLFIFDVSAGYLQEYDLHLPLMLVAVLGGGLFGSGLASLRRSKAPQRRFEAQVLRALELGLWALVLRDVPHERQAQVANLVCSRSVRWCAVAMPDHRF